MTRVTAADVPNLYRVRVRDIWWFLTTQPASFWLICIYLFLEYVRPQSIYEEIAFLPWVVVVVTGCVIAFLLENKWFQIRLPLDVVVGVFAAVVLASSLFAYSPEASYQALRLFLSWLVVYFLITNIVVTEARFLVFVLSFLLYSLKMSLHAARSWAAIGFAYRDWGVVGAPGWFHNSGEFGIQMVIFLPLSVAFIIGLRRHWSGWTLALFTLLPVTAIVGIVASTSRGAQLAAAALVVWAVLLGRRRIRALIVGVLIVIAAVALTPEEQQQRFREMGTDATSVARLTYWSDGIHILNEHPVLGIGYANWAPYYRRHYDPHGLLPHNIFIQAGSELGYAGLAALLLLIAYSFVVNRRTRRIARALPGGEGRFLAAMARGLDGAMVGFLVAGFFVTVLYYPYLWITLAMTAALHRAATEKQRRLAPPAAAPRAGTAVGTLRAGAGP